MDRPVVDPVSVGHFVLLERITGFIVEMNISFEMLKKELPKRKNTCAKGETKNDKATDSAANYENGGDLFKVQHARDIDE